MSDLRNFFGGGRTSAGAGSGAASSAGSGKPKVAPGVATGVLGADDMAIVDSDSENDKHNLTDSKAPGRLRKKSAKETETSAPSAASPSKISGSSAAAVAAPKQTPVSVTKRGSIFDVIDLSNDGDDLSSNKKAKLGSPAGISSASKSINASTSSAPALKKINAGGVARPAGAPVSIDSFFGGGSAKAATPVKSKAEDSADDDPSFANKKQKVVSSPTPLSNSKVASKESAVQEEVSTGIFDGKRLAVTGEFSINGHSRASIEELIKEHGGKVTTAVSNKTAFLVVGDCELNQSDKAVNSSAKYRDAQEKKVKILTAQEFLELIPAKEAEPLKAAQWQSSFRSALPSAGLAAPSTAFSSISPTTASAVPKKPGTAVPPSMSVPAFKPRPVTGSSSNTDDLMWVDKHKPKHLADIIGNPDIVRNVKAWLETWDAVHVSKTKKIDFKKENPGAKAMLISGPPGIGKTTMATLIGSSLGYEVIELNASDTRNKRAISEELSDVVQSRAIGFGGTMKKRMIIMDEVDGMGGSDRGGIPELIKVIKASKTPIICICNDRHSVKIKSLAGHCYDIKVKRPAKQLIAKKLVEIALKEGLNVELNAAEMLAEQSGNDIRQALHAMQMWRAQATTMKYADLRNRMGSIEKDKVLRQSFFEATLEILKGGGPNRNAPTLDERYNSFFVEYSLIPLMVQQNYIKSYVGGGVYKAASDANKLELLSKASDAVADMELAEAGIRGMDQHWELLPVCAAFTLRVGSLIQGYQGFPDFSSWMGKNSSKGRKHRLTQEIALHSMLSTGQGVGASRMEYIPYLRSFLLAPLIQKGQEGIDEVIKLLDDYGLSKEDFSESLKDLTIHPPSAQKPIDPFEALEPTLKAALTRAYNSSGHRAQALVHAEGAKKSSKRAVSSNKDEFGDYDAADLDGLVDEDEIAAAKDEDDSKNNQDVGDVSAFVKKLKKDTNAAKKTAAAAKKPAAQKKK